VCPGRKTVFFTIFNFIFSILYARNRYDYYLNINKDRYIIINGIIGKTFLFHKCDMCYKDFTLRRNLTRHIKNIHNKGLASISNDSVITGKEAIRKCPKCQLPFAGISSLRRHERSKHKMNITPPLRTRQ